MIYPDLEQNKKKFNALEPILHEINREVVFISEHKKVKSQRILNEILPTVLDKMKVDPMFNKLFQKTSYGGSYYDGLKIKDADEFDLDLVMTLPKLARPSLEVSPNHGFVEVKLTEYDSFKRHPDFKNYYSKMDRFVDSRNYLVTDKFREWFEGLLQRANGMILPLLGHRFEITVHKSGPAFTLHIYERGFGDIVDIDLVPCFIFSDDKWPGRPFRGNSTTRKDFLIVPKPFRGLGCRCWRLSFQEQERELIHGKDHLKDVLRLLKLLRDVQGQHLIASYYIKTVILWLTEIAYGSFWSKDSLSYTFMTALKYYGQLLDAHQIPYYWNENNNLIDLGKDISIFQCSQRIKRIISRIERNLDSFTELESVMNECFGYIKKECAKAEAEKQDPSWCVIL